MPPKTTGNFMVDAEDNSKKHTCEKCNGTGYVNEVETKDNFCPDCDGYGYWWD